jgi:peptidoglycan/xylan/chitin deacetylase (PgdA/CDA1 family)
VEIRAQKGRINQPVILLSGIVILSLSVLVYFLILRNVFGSFSTSSILPDFAALSDFFSGKKPTVALLYSDYTENMLPEGSTWQKDNIATWKKFLQDSKTTFDVLKDEDVENGKHFGYKIVVLPGSKSLSDREIVNLKKYLDRGGSIFATSGIASYSSDGKWRGWEFFSEVFGIKFSKEISNNEISKIHTIRGGLPLTANIPAGYPLKIASWDRPIAVEVLDPRTTQVSFWYNYRLQDGLVREEIKKTAGIVNGTYGSGRFVWMGFEPNSVIGVQEDYIYFEKLFKNSLSWLSYKPIGFIKEWPQGYEAAAVIAPTFPINMNNADNMVDILSSQKIKATFFINEEAGIRNKNTLKLLSGYGEIAALVDIGYLESVNDTVNKLLDQNIQSILLKKTKSSFEEITKKPVTGILPLNGLFDRSTLSAMIDAGFSYVMTDSLTDRSVPKSIEVGKNRVLSLTKTARDDYEIIRDFKLTQPEFQFYTYQEDVDRILFEGGLYILKLHNDFQLKAENTRVVKELINDLKIKNFWIASAEEISEWSTNRNYLDIRIDKGGESRVVVRISNSGNSEINNSVVQVDLNDAADEISINSEIIGTTPATIKYDRKTNSVFMFVSDLKPGESRIYYLDYTKRNV